MSDKKISELIQQSLQNDDAIPIQRNDKNYKVLGNQILKSASNLNDLANKETARNNLSVYSKLETDNKLDLKADQSAVDQALGLKANKVLNSTNGNFASLNDSGDLVDSNKKPSDFEPADSNILKKINVINDLTSTNIDLPLSANQGKVLQDNKVDKITGKGLSTNDFNNDYKAQLDNFAENTQDAVVNALTDTATIDFSYNDNLNQITADVKDASINNPKIATNADIATSKLKQAVIAPQIGVFSNNDTQDIINNKAQGQITNLENLLNTRPVGASNGSVYYLTSQASVIPNYELLSFSPDNSPLDIESITITSATLKPSRLIHSYISAYEVGNTIINGGNWIFNFYGYASHLNNNNFEIDVYKRNVSNVETLLFTCETSNLLQTFQTSPELNVANVEITKQDFACNTTDKIVIKIYAKTDRNTDTTITLLHSGTDYASHIHTTLITSHDNISGTKGGDTVNGRWHLALADYNKVLALDASLLLKEDVANKTTAFSATPANVKYPTEKLVKDSLDLKEDLSNKATAFSAIPANIKYPTEKLVKDNLDLKSTTADFRQESTRFVEATYGSDLDSGLTFDKAFQTVGKGWTDVNDSGQVKILGGATYNVDYTFVNSKQSIKTILDNGAKITGTINLVLGNTSMQFFDGKISATFNDGSIGTCYFNGVDLSGATLNFTAGGYKYIANASSAPALINLPNLTGNNGTSATGTLQLFNVNGAVPISIGAGWTVIKANTTLSIVSKNASAVLFDANSYVINAVITSQVALNAVLSGGVAGLYIVNFDAPSGNNENIPEESRITGLSRGDIIYRVGVFNVIINKFADAPASLSVVNGSGLNTWLKQGVNNWAVGSISSSNRLDASNIADGSISNTEFQFLNNVSSNIQTQLDNKLNTALKGANNGLAELDSTGKVPSNQLPVSVVDGNKINIIATDIASASTVNLTNATGEIVAITGTTTITAITLSAGLKRFVRFTGILTLTNGASLILPSGANITTAVGDTALFVGEASGVVRCVDYMRANGNPLAGGGSGDVSSIETTTLDNQLVLFNGTTGKSIKKSTDNGFTKLVGGQLQVQTSIGGADISILNSELNNLTRIGNSGTIEDSGYKITNSATPTNKHLWDALQTKTYVDASSSDTVSTYTLASGTGENLNVSTDKFSIITLTNGDAFVNLPATLNNSGKVMKIRSDSASIGRLYINGSEKGTDKYFILSGDTAIFECDTTSWKLITGVNYKVPFLGSGRQNSGRGLIFALEEKLMCFGVGDQQQSGHIYSPVNFSYTATELPILDTDGSRYAGTITGWKEILCSHENAIALTNEGEVFVWGLYWADGAGGKSRFPRKQTFPAGVVIDKVYMNIERNYYNSMSFFALSTTGKLYSWGHNEWGQLGLGDTSNRNNPTLITALQNKVIIKFSVSGNYGMHCSAIDNTKQLYTWGYGGSGSSGNPLGNNTDGGDVLTPTAISGITDAEDTICVGCHPFSASVGYRGYARILRSDGSSWATGFNGAGNLALNNTTTNIKVFTREAQNKTNIIRIEGGSGYISGISCIIDADFKVYFAGSNQRGIFGKGDGTDTIQFILNATQLSAGFQGKMYNESNSTVFKGINSKVKISGHNDSDQINCFILDGEGSFYVSGYNGAGVCGDGTTTDRNTFNKVKFPTNRRVVDFMPVGWQAENTNRGVVLVFEDGTMMSFGQNTQGALGNQIYPSNTVMNYPIYVIGFSPNDINEVN